MAVTVTDVGDLAPVFSSASSATFDENGTGAVYTALVTPDVTGASISYSISGGADSAKFSINSSSGVVGWKSNPDFETPDSAASSNVYDIVITATEAGNTNTVTQTVAVTVTDVGDVAPAFTSASSATFAENGTGAVYTAVVTPDVTGAVVSYSISGGADSARFSINSSSGVVGFVSSPNHESATDSGGNNVYDITISATEANNTNTVTQIVAITVTDVGDVAPAFTSGSSVSFAENGTGAVYTAVATPDAGGAVSYSIAGGDDSARFSINSSGVVSFKSSPDFETKADAGSNNVYDLVVSATEMGNTVVSTRSVVVTVTDVDDTAPIVKRVNTVKLEAPGVSDRPDTDPQITAVGAAGESVVVWSGQNSSGIATIYLQRLAANGRPQGGPVTIDTQASTAGREAYAPQVSAAGTAGAFVVVWQGQDSESDTSIFVQSFAANGSASGSVVQLEATGKTNGTDYNPQVTAVGLTGAFVVVWEGQDSGGGDHSIFVQNFAANGSASGSPVLLEAIGITNKADVSPKITAVGTAGAFVVVWQGQDSEENDHSIFVQKFAADGSTSGNPVAMESGGHTDKYERDAQVTAVGTAGEFVVVWGGFDAAGSATVHVQKFDANGAASGDQMSMTPRLGAGSVQDLLPQVIQLGVSGEFVVVWSGEDSISPNDNSIFVQKFDTNGAASGSAVQLEATGNANGKDSTPQVTAVGTAGEFVVVWSGVSSNSTETNIYVQKFHANGSISGSAVHLSAINETDSDQAPQVTAVGTAGEFIVTWFGNDTDTGSGSRSNSIFVQKFAADGSPAFDPVVVSSAAELAAAVVPVLSNELGKAYLVKDDIDLSVGIAALTATNQAQWNEVAITAVNTETNLSVAGLVNGTYDLYAVDVAGNVSLPVTRVLTVMGV